MNLLRPLFDLFFPRLCAGCGVRLHDGEHFVCIGCINRIDSPYTHLSDVELQLMGRVPIHGLYSPFIYTKHSVIQQIIHQFKYRNDPKLAFYMGQQLGHYLSSSPFIANLDLIIPVPLHPNKLKLRGYNQSSKLSEGISSILHIPVYDHTLLRMVSNPTQTTLHKQARWANVETIFSVSMPEEIKGKQILLIDDVFTTGSTLESCARTLLTIPDVTVYVSTLAIV